MKEEALHIWLKSVTDRFGKKVGFECESYLWFVPGEGWNVRVNRKQENDWLIQHGESWTFKATSMDDLMIVGNKWVEEFDIEALHAKAVNAVYGTGMQVTSTGGSSGRGLFGGGGASTASSAAWAQQALTNQLLQNTQSNYLGGLGAIYNGLGQNGGLNRAIQITIGKGGAGQATPPSPPKNNLQAAVDDAYKKMTAESAAPPSFLKQMKKLLKP